MAAWQTGSVGASGAGTYGTGNTQIINGVSYRMYSPEWYAARDASKVQQAGVAGTAAGTAVKAFKDTTGSTSGFGPGSSSSASGTSGASIPRISGSTTSTSGGSGTPGAGGITDPANINAQAQAAQDAALARAKENAGLISRSALTGLHEALGERQMLGSGAEAQATGDVAMKGAGLINDVNVAGLDKQSNLAQRLAELSYTGRGQDITRELGNLNAQVAQRGQDVQMRGQDYQREAAQAGQYYNETSLLLNALKNLVY